MGQPETIRPDDHAIPELRVAWGVVDVTRGLALSAALAPQFTT
jgi:hypothetical protein